MSLLAVRSMTAFVCQDVHHAAVCIQDCSLARRGGVNPADLDDVCIF